MTKLLLGLIALAATLTGCTEVQVQAFTAIDRDGQDALMIHVLRDAAFEFQVDPDLLVRIARCESGLDPAARNRSSGAAGLGQHLPQYWPARAAAIDMPDASPFDPVANARVSAWMLSTQGTAPWNPSRLCWSR